MDEVEMYRRVGAWDRILELFRQQLANDTFDEKSKDFIKQHNNYFDTDMLIDFVAQQHDWQFQVDVLKSNHRWWQAGRVYEENKEWELAVGMFRQGAFFKEAAMLAERHLKSRYEEYAYWYEQVGEPRWTAKAGEIWYEHRRWENALRCFEQCEGKDEIAGELYEHLNDFESALEKFKSAKSFIRAAKMLEKLSRIQESVELLIQHGYHKEAGDTLKRYKRVEEAIIQYHRASAFSESGALFRQKRQFREAAEDFEKAKKFGDAGQMFFKAQDFKRAFDIFLKANMLKECGECQEKLQNYSEAAEYYEASKQHVRAGRCWETAGNKKEAAEAFVCGKRYQHAGELFYELQLFEECLDTFVWGNNRLGGVGLIKSHHEVISHSKWAAVLKNWNELDLLILLMRKHRLHRPLALILKETPRWKEAIVDFLQADEWIEAGQLHERANELDSAFQCFIKKEAYELAAAVLVKKGDRFAATKLLEEHKLFLPLARLFEQMNNFSEAIESYQKAKCFRDSACLLKDQCKLFEAGCDFEKCDAFIDAAWCYANGRRWMDAHRCFDKAHLIPNALDMLFKGEMLLEAVEYQIGHRLAVPLHHLMCTGKYKMAFLDLRFDERFAKGPTFFWSLEFGPIPDNITWRNVYEKIAAKAAKEQQQFDQSHVLALRLLLLDFAEHKSAHLENELVGLFRVSGKADVDLKAETLNLADFLEGKNFIVESIFLTASVKEWGKAVDVYSRAESEWACKKDFFSDRLDTKKPMRWKQAYEYFTVKAKKLSDEYETLWLRAACSKLILFLGQARGKALIEKRFAEIREMAQKTKYGTQLFNRAWLDSAARKMNTSKKDQACEAILLFVLAEEWREAYNVFGRTGFYHVDPRSLFDDPVTNQKPAELWNLSKYYSSAGGSMRNDVEDAWKPVSYSLVLCLLTGSVFMSDEGLVSIFQKSGLRRCTTRDACIDEASNFFLKKNHVLEAMFLSAALKNWEYCLETMRQHRLVGSFELSAKFWDLIPALEKPQSNASWLALVHSCRELMTKSSKICEQWANAARCLLFHIVLKVVPNREEAERNDAVTTNESVRKDEILLAEAFAHANMNMEAKAIRLRLNPSKPPVESPS